MNNFVYGKTKCDRCGKQIRPKKNFRRITFGLYGNEHPENSVEGLFDLCESCYLDINEMFIEWLNEGVKQ